MKKIYLVTDKVDWILNHKKKDGGGGVVADKIYKTLLKIDDITPVVVASSMHGQIQNSQNPVIYIDYEPKSQNFTDKAKEITQDAHRIFTLNTSLPFEGEIIQSHSAAHRAKNTPWPIRIFKTLLYKKKIEKQKKRFSKLNNYQRVFAVSKIIKEDYEKNYGVKNIVVCYPGCDKIYEEFPQNQSQILTFGIVANSSLNKNGHYFITALGIAKLLGLKAKLKIIAPKFEKDMLMKILFKIFGLDTVAEVMDRQDDMTYFYKNIDCLCMPSVNEAFGLVALEAMSYGKTCLVSDTTGFSEILDTDTGFTFNVHSINDFVAKLKQIGYLFYNNRAEFDRICKNSFELSKKYSWENFVLNLLKE